MPDLEDIKGVARMLIASEPDPIPRFRLFRDVLAVPRDSPLLAEAYREVMKSRWIGELEQTQEENGIWGRFHSQDTRVRKRFVTTECAVQRALTLGLDKNSALLKKNSRVHGTPFTGRGRMVRSPGKT